MGAMFTLYIYMKGICDCSSKCLIRLQHLRLSTGSVGRGPYFGPGMKACRGSSINPMSSRPLNPPKVASLGRLAKRVSPSRTQEWSEGGTSSSCRKAMIGADENLAPRLYDRISCKLGSSIKNRPAPSPDELTGSDMLP
eukprot:CAMPEP_0196575646 /NCGR_PEP_ID=MMETSP1081-20130531/5080_1 /TAXON_ID=36882 /ORGANISM="Pyramimonas amylifera, Strain CCMP720" /LENGTH=138 /DNA_ID=CAMNT_0041894007 /DNA_START=881 /DNA_END=1293 /DNA_ORIENTATION=-